ncbi:MAG: PilZ domain-containing protein [Deltaproteobacteria bacterium]|nr:MAG: PilZ domain-containing protein [Deltaproteobacteria bacterium]
MPGFDYEKRRTLRVPVAFKVRVETKFGVMHGMGRDLSEGGMGVYLKKLPPVGSPVELSFEIPGSGRKVNITGEVMYQKRGKAGTDDDWIGVRFLRMDAESQLAIRDFVKKRGSGASPAPDRTPPPLPPRQGG